jgi:thioesterase domain-containing protein/acyl carrier protein
MPLFHIHGIVAALLGSLRAGGSVVCTPGFDRTAVEAWIEEFEPTWYTAVPTIHQALLDIASRRSDGGRSMWPGLRLIRSSSAALPVPVGTALEETFGVPVIEAYGMTEAAHQIASNPVPPGERKPGTVGLPAGPEVAVLDDDDNLRPAGVEGHVALRGPTISTAVLTNGWFRTGDQGRFDDDGYLTLTGRTKEMINRGGEKVAPREVDDALLSHPDVVHAVAFAIPHPRLGEEVGAAVVLRDGADVSVGQLRLFVAEELAPYKVPRRIVVVDEIPRGPSGKLVRIGLADVLGLSVADPCGARVEPVDDVERELVAIWQRVLGLDAPPSTDVEFFELGGDSLHAVELFTAIEATLGRRLDAKLLLSAPTVRAMAAEMRSPSRGADAVTVVPVQTSGSKPPLFCLLRAGSIVATRLFAEDLGPDQPVYGLWIPSMHGPPGAAGSVEHIAALGAEAIRATCGGPYALFGHSLGGTVMYDVARQLADGGATVALLVLADSVHPRLLAAQWKRRHSVRYRLRKLFSGKGPEIVSRRTRQLLRLRDSTPPVRRLPGTDAVVDLHAAVDRERRYVPRPAPYPVAILATRPFIRFAGATDLGWAEMLTGPWWADEVPGNHDTMVGEPHIHVLTARLAERLDHSATEELLA